MTSKCRSCEAPIAWAKTVTDTWMPIDAKPDERGNVMITSDGKGLTATIISEENQEVWPRYTSHFQTCKQADEWRKK